MMKTEIADLGVEHSQYFQGFGVSNTEFENCVTGAGFSFGEAVEDALNQVDTPGAYDALKEGSDALHKEAGDIRWNKSVYEWQGMSPEDIENMDDDIAMGIDHHYYVGMSWADS